MTLAAIALGSISCELPNEQLLTDPQARLRFSADTVFFDTVFTSIKTITRRVRVYNDHSGLLSISKIELAKPNTPFILTVNGLPGTSFADTRLLGGDSLLLLIEANIDPQDQSLPYIVEDKILFSTNGNNQALPVIAWGQDAHFLKDSILVCNTTWTAGKPYVIYDNILVDSLCTLTIEAGTRVFSHFNSGIFVKGQLFVNGNASEQVVFSNDRFDVPYKTTAGQWNGITFLQGSEGNEISFARINNAVNGIWLGTPDDNTIADLTLRNTIIENMSQTGLIAFTADLTMQNCLINNCGQFVFAGLAGGNYIFEHNTLANYGYGFFKQQPVFVITDNLLLADGSEISGNLYLELSNNIVWGVDDDELQLFNEAGLTFEVFMQHSILKSGNPEFDINNNQLNVDPLFIDSPASNYQLDSLSPALDAGIDIGIMNDLNDSTRSNPPDIGAYEYF